MNYRPAQRKSKPPLDPVVMRGGNSYHFIMRRIITSSIIIGFATVLIATGCGGSGPSQGNYIRPIMLEGCPTAAQGDGMAVDQRSLVAMIAALAAARYQIHEVSPVDFKIYTHYKNVRGGATVGWEAQVYSDGSVSLTLPSTAPMQGTKALAAVTKYGHQIARHFNKIKCRPAQDLRRRCQKAGFSF